MRNKTGYRLAVVLAALSFDPAQAMGLRSFVALPVEAGGLVTRLMTEHNVDNDIDTLFVNGAYGLSGRQTLLVGTPYRLSPAGGDRLGDLSLLYRHIAWQHDTFGGTRRLGLLGGVVLPTESSRDHALQAGLVTTIYRGRTEWDLDGLYQVGLADRPDSGRYDVSFQYRLAPAEYPDWGIGAEWNAVVELNGRWESGATMVNQVTGGLQWIHPGWVLEAGVTQDLNGPGATRLISSIRLHF